MEISTYGSQVPYMPKEKVALIRAGVSLYELRAPGETFFNKVITGPFNANSVAFGAGNTVRHQVEWVAGMSTGLTYDADGDGNAIAWMPDDPWWHNRLQLLLDPWLNAIQKHTPQGIVPGYIIQFELQALRNVLRFEEKTFDVWVDGHNKDWFKTKEEAEAYIEDKKTYAMKMGPNGMVQVPTNKRKYEIKPGKRWEYRPEVLELIDKSRHERYGWTSSMAFQKEWKPLIIREYERLKSSTTAQSKAAVTPEDLAMAIASMNTEDKERFLAIMSGKPAAKKVDKDVVVASKPTGPLPPKKRDIQNMRKAEIIEILGKTGDIDYELKSRPDLIQEAFDKFGYTSKAEYEEAPAPEAPHDETKDKSYFPTTGDIPSPDDPAFNSEKTSPAGEALVTEDKQAEGEVRVEE